MLPFTIIKEFVRTSYLYDLNPNIKKLLPVDRVFEGYGVGGGEEGFIFEPPQEYGECYIKTVDTNNIKQRIDVLTSINKDIQNYNDWASKKNKVHTDEVFSLIPHDGKVHRVSESGLKTKYYPLISKHSLWKCSFYIARPQFDKSNDKNKKIVTIDSEELYSQKEHTNLEEFKKRLNATIFQFIQNMVDQEKKFDAWSVDSVWYYPNKEFVNWFSSKGLVIKKIDVLELSNESSNREIWNGTLYFLAEDMRWRKNQGEFEYYVTAYRWASEHYWHNKIGNKINPDLLASEYRKAKSSGKIED